MADHLGLDFHLVEGLAIVNSNHASDHFWDNDHVSQVRFHIDLCLQVFKIVVDFCDMQGVGYAEGSPRY